MTYIPRSSYCDAIQSHRPLQPLWQRTELQIVRAAPRVKSIADDLTVGALEASLFSTGREKYVRNTWLTLKRWKSSETRTSWLPVSVKLLR